VIFVGLNFIGQAVCTGHPNTHLKPTPNPKLTLTIPNFRSPVLIDSLLSWDWFADRRSTGLWRDRQASSSVMPWCAVEIFVHSDNSRCPRTLSVCHHELVYSKCAATWADPLAYPRIHCAVGHANWSGDHFVRRSEINLWLRAHDKLLAAGLLRWVILPEDFNCVCPMYIAALWCVRVWMLVNSTTNDVCTLPYRSAAMLCWHQPDFSELIVGILSGKSTPTIICFTANTFVWLIS